MTPIERVQNYLRHSARQSYEAVTVPPFTAFFHPHDTFTFFNYAIPDAPVGGDLSQPLAQLREVVETRGRVLRFEFIEEFAPDLAPALTAAGCAEESRLWLMGCTPDSAHSAPEVPGLTITRLHSDSPVTEGQAFRTTQGRGFNPTSTHEATVEEGQTFLAGLGTSGAFLGWVAGEVVAVAAFSAPHDGLTELTGIATLEAMRRRGIAGALTARAVQEAFAQGVELAILSAADERAGRVYERVGFQPLATMLAYYQP